MDNGINEAPKGKTGSSESLNFTEIVNDDSNTAKTETAPPSTGQECSESKLYTDIIDTAFDHSQNPERLGSKADAINKPNCNIENEEDAVNAANDTLAKSGDRFTKAYKSKPSDYFPLALEGKYRGVGAVFQLPESENKDGQPAGKPIVEEVIDGSTGQTAGLKAGDIVLAINGKSTQDMSFKEFAMEQNDPGNEKINLLVERNGEMIELSADSKVHDIPAVESKLLEGHIAYIRLRTFLQKDTSDELKKHLEKYSNANGFVIDLRDNIGGLKREFLDTAGMFVEEGEIGSFRQRIPGKGHKTTELGFGEKFLWRDTTEGDSLSSKFWESFPSSREADIVDKPTVVLTNAGTASSAELFAATLSQNEDAILVGEKTRGKSIAQAEIPVEGHQDYKVMVTMGQFEMDGFGYLGDAYENRQGLTPNHKVKNAAKTVFGSNEDKQLKTALKIIEDQQQ